LDFPDKPENDKAKAGRAMAVQTRAFLPPSTFGKRSRPCVLAADPFSIIIGS
jgi:hypothetical protein